MNVVIVTQVYAPEMGASSERLRSLASGLLSRGHSVTVVTGMPNYPGGRVFDGYRGRLALTETIDSIRVIRHAYLTAKRNVSALKQLLSYLSFLPASLIGGLRSGHVDVVIVSSPPLFPALVGITFAYMRRCAMVLDLRDLWPDEIVACGGISPSSPGIRLLSLLERWSYKHADVIACTTRSFIRTVASRGEWGDKLMYIPNGADTERFSPGQRDNRWLSQHGLADKFVVLYSGALGLKHGLDALVDTADLLRSDESIVFVIAGDGASRAKIEREVTSRQLHNVKLVGEVAAADIPSVIRSSDLCVATLAPNPYLEKILAVKLFEYMACGRPVVAAVGGESAQLLSDSGAGVCTAPGDAQQLAAAIQELKVDSLRRDAMEVAGPRYIRENFCRQQTADAFAHTLEELHSRRR